MRKLLVFSAIMMFTIYAMEQSPTVKLFEAFIEDGKLDEFKACSPQLDELGYSKIGDLASKAANKNRLLVLASKIGFSSGTWDAIKTLIEEAPKIGKERQEQEQQHRGLWGGSRGSPHYTQQYLQEEYNKIDAIRVNNHLDKDMQARFNALALTVDSDYMFFGKTLKNLMIKAENAACVKVAEEPAPFEHHLKAYIAQEQSKMEVMQKMLDVEQNKYVKTWFYEGERCRFTIEKKQ